MKIDKDDFEAWQANPVTQTLMRKCEEWIETAKACWVQASWEGGNTDETFLAKLQGQALALRDIIGLSVEDLEEENAKE